MTANTTNGALSRNPVTNDQLLPNRFRFFLKRAPNVEFWIQKVQIPGFSIPNTGQPNPFVEIPLSGEHIDYEALGIEMLVDADLANYTEISEWLRGLGKPTDFNQYARLLKAPAILDKGVKSDIVVTILNGQQVPKLAFTFHDAFPTALGGFQLDATAPDLGRIVCHVEFKYTSFTLAKMNVPVEVNVGID